MVPVADARARPNISSPFSYPHQQFSTLYNSLHNDDNNAPKSNIIRGKGKNVEAKSPSIQSAFISLLCATSLLFSNLDATLEVPGSTHTTISTSYKALALDYSSNEMLQSTTWPPPPSTTEVPRNKQRYWDSMRGTAEDVMFANEKLIDHAVATISTMYYDSSGGFRFDSQEFYKSWKKFRYSVLHPHEGGTNKEKKDADEFDLLVESNGFGTREDAVKTLKSIVSSLQDPYSKYLTREELRMELEGGDDGFLGLGALVDVVPSQSAVAFDTQYFPKSMPSEKKDFYRAASRPIQGGVSLDNAMSTFNQQFAIPISSTAASGNKRTPQFLSESQAANLPVITAIIPDSPAERAGLIVGDRIASVGEYQFTGMNRAQVQKALAQHFHAENYFGRADLTIAKQVVARSQLGSDTDNAHYDANGNVVEDKYVFENGWYVPRPKRQEVADNILLGYKLSHMKSIPTTLTAKLDKVTNEQRKFPSVIGGDSVVHYQLLTPNDSIFQHSSPVGYVRMTRFSKSSTKGYINAINSLEEAGAQSYIIDLRNNYGGVIQEAMMTASSLLRDPHYVLCYTLNSRGGFKPQENQEYISDPMYPGYLLSSEPSTVSRDQVRREHPEYLEDGGWTSPTSYASLKELRMTRGIKPAHVASVEGWERPTTFVDRKEIDIDQLANMMTKNSQKKLVILINEGTGKCHLMICFSCFESLLKTYIYFAYEPTLDKQHRLQKSLPAHFMTMDELLLSAKKPLAKD